MWFYLINALSSIDVKTDPTPTIVVCDLNKMIKILRNQKLHILKKDQEALT